MTHARDAPSLSLNACDDASSIGGETIYGERATGVPGAVLWTRAGAGTTTILPDGCLDLIWVDGALVVAGPDSVARPHTDTDVRRRVGLRLSRGLGPRVLGVPADALRDRTPALDDLWGARRTATLAARLDADPVAGLAAWLTTCAEPDPFGARVVDGLDAGCSVAVVAERLGTGPRTLHRRCLATFGYGPQHLSRVLRLQRALGLARRGRTWAQTAATVGYVDQQHLAREVRALTGTTPTRLLAGGPA